MLKIKLSNIMKAFRDNDLSKTDKGTDNVHISP